MSWSAEFATPCVSPESGVVLRRLAAAPGTRAVVEIGTGLGVSGLWLLHDLPPRAVLTSIDIDADLQAMARQAYAAAGHARGRFRLILGRAEVMLGRLADGGYDLMFVDVEDQRALCTEAAARLLRPGGVLAIHQPTAGDHTRLLAPPWTAATVEAGLLTATWRPAEARSAG